MVIDSKLELFRKKMHNAGYSSLQRLANDISVLYRLDGNKANIIICINLDNESSQNKYDLQQIKDEIKQIFESSYEKQNKDNFSGLNIGIFILLWTQQSNFYKELVQNEPYSWIIDLKENRLIIYEHQKDDYPVLKEIIEETLNYTEKFENKLKNIVKAGAIKPINLVIILVNILVYFVLERAGNTEDAVFMLNKGAMYPEAIIDYKQYYRFITSMFMHFGISHLFNNMFILFFLGNMVETIIGSIKYLLIYIFSGIGGGILSLWYAIKINEFSVAAGASGAVFGIIGALLFISIRTKGRYLDLSPRRIILMIALSLYYGFTAANVGNMAHIGGLITGIILGALLFKSDEHRKC